MRFGRMKYSYPIGYDGLNECVELKEGDVFEIDEIDHIGDAWLFCEEHQILGKRLYQKITMKEFCNETDKQFLTPQRNK